MASLRLSAALLAMAIAWLGGGVSAQTADQAPVGLPDYFRPAIEIGGRKLAHVGRDTKDGVVSDRYASADHRVNLLVERIDCDDVRCLAMFDNARNYLNGVLGASGGRFRTVTTSDLRTENVEAGIASTTFVFRLPTALQFWTIETPAPSTLDIDDYFEQVTAMVDRQRYQQARAEGNVVVGRWGPEIHRHARRLLRAGATDEAVGVLATLLPSAPTNYEAQIDFATHSKDKAAVQRSAAAVLNGTEDGVLYAAAQRLLGQRSLVPEEVPLLEMGLTGLQLVLIPLPPCDLSLLEAAAKVYETITQVPTRIRRLPVAWALGQPERVPDQRRLQQAIIQARGTDVDFTGWTRERYASELLSSFGGADPLRRHFVELHLQNLSGQPGQYEAEPRLAWLSEALAPYRSADRRTMFVGVTAVGLYLGNANYVFSGHIMPPTGGVSILSYDRMTAKALGAPFQSRRRLVERIAKELVPASLKSLSIPRPADPTDPYSYADSVERLDQKSLTLSPPVKEALDQFRY